MAHHEEQSSSAIEQVVEILCEHGLGVMAQAMQTLMNEAMKLAPSSRVCQLLLKSSLPPRIRERRSGDATTATTAESPSPRSLASPGGRPPPPLRVARSRLNAARTPPLRARPRGASLRRGRALAPVSRSTRGVAPKRISRHGADPERTRGPSRL